MHGHLWSKLYVKVLHFFRDIGGIIKVLNVLGVGDDVEVVFVEHHLAHAACAYYSSPWEKALVLTNDGAGDGLSSTVNIGEGWDIRRLASSTYYDSVGNIFYSEITAYLGMKRWEHEYKVMGLAPYGRAEYCLDRVERIIGNHPKRKLEFKNLVGACGTRVQGKLRKLLAGHRFDNIAAATQKHFEKIVCRWVKNAVEETGVARVAAAGGLFLNVKCNQKIRDLEEVEDLFVYPACDDGGTPVGAALVAYHKFCEAEGVKPVKHKLGPIYYGMGYTEEEVRIALEKAGLAKEAEHVGSEDMPSRVAEMVAAGKVVARFDGRLEWGPRALGNRSILADPRDLRVVRRINDAIKHRDFWMPFAPSILEERCEEYLVDARFAPYMIESFNTTKKGEEELIAALHPKDLTVRPQVVRKTWNPSYYKVLKEFENLTGVGGVLNTSFNLHGYPIVGTPELALWTWKNSELDALAIGPYLLTR